MEPIYSQNFTLTDVHVNCFGRLKTSMLLYFIQEVAGKHFEQLSMDYDSLESRGLFWAITRHKVQITRIPRHGETIRVETWPMPTTRVAYPRSVVAYDEQGNECFRAITLWVLMDLQNRAMVLPGKSGIEVAGTLRGNELSSPLGLPAKALRNRKSRTVAFTDLDRNGHMNNTKYLDWLDDLLPSSFHGTREVKELTLCYLSEAREGQDLVLDWDFLEENTLFMDAHRDTGEKTDRVFAAKILYN